MDMWDKSKGLSKANYLSCQGTHRKPLQLLYFGTCKTLRKCFLWAPKNLQTEHMTYMWKTCAWPSHAAACRQQTNTSYHVFGYFKYCIIPLAASTVQMLWELLQINLKLLFMCLQNFFVFHLKVHHLRLSFNMQLCLFHIKHNCW